MACRFKDSFMPITRRFWLHVSARLLSVVPGNYLPAGRRTVSHTDCSLILFNGKGRVNSRPSGGSCVSIFPTQPDSAAQGNRQAFGGCRHLCVLEPFVQGFKGTCGSGQPGGHVAVLNTSSC